MRLGTLMFIMLLLAGCMASRRDMQHLTPDLQRLSAGQIGCPQGSIMISDVQVGEAMASWTATCLGNHYFCAAEDTFRAVSCALKLEEK